MVGTFNLEEVRSGASDGLVGVLTNRNPCLGMGGRGLTRGMMKGQSYLKMSETSK